MTALEASSAPSIKAWSEHVIARGASCRTTAAAVCHRPPRHERCLLPLHHGAERIPSKPVDTTERALPDSASKISTCRNGTMMVSVRGVMPPQEHRVSMCPYAPSARRFPGSARLHCESARGGALRAAKSPRSVVESASGALLSGGRCGRQCYVVLIRTCAFRRTMPPTAQAVWRSCWPVPAGPSGSRP